MHHGDADPDRREVAPRGRRHHPWTTRQRREGGIGYIPEDRSRHGLLLEASLWENRMLGHQTQPPNSGVRCSTGAAPGWTPNGSWRSTTSARRASRSWPSALSGGNQQKLIVGREMSGRPRMLIASHPTRGVDVGAQAAIWDLLRAARRDGLAVLLISADLDELIGLSDSLQVLLRGRLVASADPATVTPEELGSAMTGAEAGDDVKRLAAHHRRAGARARASRSPSRSGILIATGHGPLGVFTDMFDYGRQPASLSLTLNLATTYYLSALAVAIGFRMNLFNIGVDGQYRLAALIAAAVGGALHLPAVLHVTVILVVAMLVGASWAAVAAVLKNRRGVSEVISTIMLNYIATGVIAFLLTPDRLAELVPGSNNVEHAADPGVRAGSGACRS